MMSLLRASVIVVCMVLGMQPVQGEDTRKTPTLKKKTPSVVQTQKKVKPVARSEKRSPATPQAEKKPQLPSQPAKNSQPPLQTVRPSQSVAQTQSQTQPTTRPQSKEADAPKKEAVTKDDLFSLDDEEDPPTKSIPDEPPQTPSIAKSASEQVTRTRPRESQIRWSGFVQEEVARAYRSPSHWSKILTRAQLAAQGQLSSALKWKLSARADYDAVFDLTDHYSSSVRDDREFNVLLRENYLDWSVGDVDLRLGRQQIVWGEMVGLFFADVVSARDMREFILPDFDIMRIPQWAVRAEYFRNDWHSEFVWIPYVSVDEIGKPGDDFYPVMIPATGLGLEARDTVRPNRNLKHTNTGVRVGVLKNGWDVAGFFYHGVDASPYFTRTIENLPAPTVVYTPRHNRIWQLGGTLAKDFGTFVVKGETIYTHGKNFSVTDFSDADGVVKQNLLDYVLGIDWGLRETDIRFNAQLFQRASLNHVDSLLTRKYESGASFLVRAKKGNLEPQLLIIQSLNRNDGLVRPRVDWTLAKNLRLRGGLDIFYGPEIGLFGQYNINDRGFVELRYTF